MPSPIAHLAVGSWIAHSASRTASSKSRTLRIWGVCLFFSMAPDLDTIVGLLAGALHVYHNQITHSMAFVVLFCLAAVWPVRKLIPEWSLRQAFLIPLACAMLHLLMDWTTRGRGLLLFWPFDRERWLAPVTLFYGVRWSDGLLSMRHWITLGTEILTIAIGFALFRILHHSDGENIEDTSGISGATGSETVNDKF